ncbi:GNAT family N-acetyltransferase [uncultured Bacteroides sp.]|uniref:GNAT family N-acetyltransferase n=1 Tax=uncultured Bacteroides sp. TaxID=162156 RepID=UPI002AA91A82|nr:GNAT family N-acetyltransferase [uncultured Bacteroides sp.]
MEKNAYLTDDRIYLRAVEPEDLEVMYEMENHPSFWEISSFTVPYSRYTLKEYILNSQNDVFADKQLRLMIVRREDDKVIGTIDITDYIPLHAHGAVGIAVLETYRREGYAARALRLLCEYAFNFLDMKQLYANVPIDNEASLQLFSSCGFVECGVLKEWLHAGKGYKDVIMMQCINN